MPGHQPLPTFQALLTCFQGPSLSMESSKLSSWPHGPSTPPTHTHTPTHHVPAGRWGSAPLLGARPAGTQ